MSDRLGDVVFLSHTHWRGDFVVGSHHLARELSLVGYRVARVVTPLSALHCVMRRSDAENSFGRWARGDEVASDDYGVFNARAATALPAQWARGSYGDRLLRRLQITRPRFVFVDQPLMLARWVFDLGATVIYRPTDIHLSSIATRLEGRWLGRVDGIAATSRPVLEHVIDGSAKPTQVIENGAELRVFARAGRPWPERSGVVYVGALDHRFDWDALCSIAAQLRDVRFTIAGPAPERTAPPNVALIGPVPYSDVPALIGSHRVALMPFSDAPENRGRSPMKLFESIAAGLRVVVSRNLGVPLDGLRGLCQVYESAEDAVEKIVGALGEPPAPESVRHAVRGQDWEDKAAALMDFAKSVEASRCPEGGQRERNM